VKGWRLRRTARAEQDLFEIWAYIAAEDESAADRTIDMIRTAIGRAADFPRLGRTLSWLPDDHRVLASGSYLLFYQLLEAERELLLIRVLHGARDLRAIFESD